MVDKEQVEHGRVHWEELVWIAASGGVGGALVWVWEIWREIVSWSFVKLALIPMYIAFGAGSAAVFILLIANSERSDRVRIVALALLAGFVWKPIWTSSGDMFGLPQEKESKIDYSRDQAEIRLVDGSTQQTYAQSLTRSLAEPQGGLVEVPMDEPQEVAAESLGTLVVETEAENPNVDLVDGSTQASTRSLARSLAESQGEPVEVHMGEPQGIAAESFRTPVAETEAGSSNVDLADGLIQTYAQMIARLLAEPQGAPVEVRIGGPQEIAAESFEFTVNEEGTLVVETEAENPNVDLVAILYRHDGEGFRAIDIDDDSGSGLNPRIHLDGAEPGSYLVVLRAFGSSSPPYRGKTRVEVKQG